MRTSKLGFCMVGLSLACSSTKLDLGTQDDSGGTAGVNAGGQTGISKGGAPNGSGGAKAGGSISTGGSSSTAGTTGAGAPGTTGGSSGFTPPDSFSKLTLVSLDGFPEPPPDDAECDPFRFPNTYTLDTSTISLEWSRCVALGPLQTRLLGGVMTLSPEQLQATKDAVAALQPGNLDNCGVDADLVTLDLQTENEVMLLEGDLSSCEPAIEGRTFVGNLPPLTDLLVRFTRVASPPDAQRLTVVSLARATRPPRGASDECAPDLYPDTYVVDVAASTLSWDYCAGPSPTLIRAGSRALSEAELNAALDAYAKVEIDVRRTCVANQALITMDVETEQGALRLVDESDACQPAPESRTFASNIEGVLQAVIPLLPPE